jgi:hypothetical protein
MQQFALTEQASHTNLFAQSVAEICDVIFLSILKRCPMFQSEAHAYNKCRPYSGVFRRLLIITGWQRDGQRRPNLRNFMGSGTFLG